jgi:GT2 family glycosyltransferase
MKLHVIMACHNRRNLSVRSVLSAVAAASFARIPIDFTIFDDGSGDGTTEGLRALDADITVLSGDGSAFWAKSMAMAESEVLNGAEFCDQNNCWIVWLNDDVTIDESAFQRAIDAGILTSLNEPETGVVGVGSVRDPETGSITYGGLRRTGLHPLRYSQVPSSQTLEPIDTFNGNLVFVPEFIARRIGGIDGGFSHALADIDYGLRCRRLNIPVFLLPDTYGVCSRNTTEATGRFGEEWRRFTGPKGGGNLYSMVRILKKTSPYSWPAFASATYGLWFFRNLSRFWKRESLSSTTKRNESIT